MVYAMGYTLDDLAVIIEKLSIHGIDSVVIGDTVVQLALKKKVLEGDIDLFVLKPSVIVDEGVFIELAEKNNWHYSMTEAGTPRIVARIGDKEIPIEFYENIFDIYIPEEIINNARSINVKGVKIKLIKPEEYIVLKARQGIDLDKLAKYIRELKGLDKKVILKTLELMPEDEKKTIVNRLRQVGIVV